MCLLEVRRKMMRGCGGDLRRRRSFENRGRGLCRGLCLCHDLFRGLCRGLCPVLDLDHHTARHTVQSCSYYASHCSLLRPRPSSSSTYSYLFGLPRVVNDQDTCSYCFLQRTTRQSSAVGVEGSWFGTCGCGRCRRGGRGHDRGLCLCRALGRGLDLDRDLDRTACSMWVVVGAAE